MTETLEQELKEPGIIKCFSIAVSAEDQASKSSLQRKAESKNDTFTFVVNEFLYQLSSFFSDDSSTEKEEKAIAAIKKEPIQVDQFLQRLRQKKLDKYLNFEVRVSKTFLFLNHFHSLG